MSNPVHDGHTVDVGYVHTLTAPGGPCTTDCPHPSHELDRLRAENALLRDAIGLGVTGDELRALATARKRHNAIADLEASARAWQRIATEFEAHCDDCGRDPCAACDALGHAVNAAEASIRTALTDLDGSS